MFDQQEIEHDYVVAAWRTWFELASPEQQAMQRDPPSFSNDKDTLPLQAADLAAGWGRLMAESELLNLPTQMPWGDTGDHIPSLTHWWDEAYVDAVTKAIADRVLPLVSTDYLFSLSRKEQEEFFAQLLREQS